MTKHFQWILLRGLVLFLASSPALAMGKKHPNASNFFEGETESLRTFNLDKKRIKLEFDHPISSAEDKTNSFTLIRTKDTPNQVTVAVTETDPYGDSSCATYETKTATGEAAECGTGVRYVNDCRDEKECSEQVIEIPGQAPQKSTTCTTVHRCGVYPQAYTLSCTYTYRSCVDYSYSPTKKTWTFSVSFEKALLLAGDQTEELEFVMTYLPADRDVNVLRVNRSSKNYKIKRERNEDQSFRVIGMDK